MKSKILILCLLFILQCKKTKTIRIEDERETGSNMSLKNFTRESYNDSGIIQWKLKAEEAFIYVIESGNKTTLYNVEFEQFEKGDYKSTLKGDKGSIDHSTKLVHVWDNIFLKTKDLKELEGEELEYNTETEILTSNKKVKITSNGTIIEGIGLKAEKNLNKFTILKPTAITKEGNPFKKDETEQK